MRAVCKLLALSAADRRLLLSAGWALICGIALRVLPYSFLREVLRREESTLSGNRFHPKERVVWAVKAWSRRLPAANCLAQAVATQRLLRRNGYPAEVRIGVAGGTGATFRAHAWVECDGQVLIGGADSPAQFTALAG